MDGSIAADFGDALEGDTSTGDFSATEALPVRKDSIDELCGHRERALQLYRQGYELIEQARSTHARACVGASHISSFPHDHLRYYTAGEANKFAMEMQHIVDRDMWRAFIVGTPIGSLMDTEERKKFESEIQGVPPEATPDNVFSTLSRLAGEAPLIFRRGLVNAFSHLCRDYKSHDGFKIGDRIVLTYVVSYDKSCNWLTTGYRVEEHLKDVDRVMHVLDGKPTPEYQQGLCSALRDAVRLFRSSGLMECETEYWKLKFFKNGNGHLFPKRKDLVEKANKLIAAHYGMVVGAAPDVANKRHEYRPSENLTPDFFPTPAAVVDMMIDAAGLQPGQRVLEPSAGEDAIALGIMAETGMAPDCIEVNAARASTLRTALNAAPGVVQCRDFLEMTGPFGAYDRVLLNPPFSQAQSLRHVTHAISFLKPGGRLVALMPSGVTFRQDAAHVEFRNIILGAGGTITPLPSGSFKVSGTGVETVLVTVDA